MLGLKKQEVQKELELRLKELRKSERELRVSDKKMREWQKRANACKDIISSYRRKIRHLQEALVITTGLPLEVLKLREALLENRSRAQRKDVRIDAHEKIVQEIKKQEQNLHEKCPHPFVLKLSYSYGGSYTNERKDSHRGQHICVVCGHEERSRPIRPTTHINTREDIYPTLNAGSNCYVSDQFRVQNLKKPLYIWVPIEQLLEEYFINGEFKKLLNFGSDSPNENSA